MRHYRVILGQNGIYSYSSWKWLIYAKYFSFDLMLWQFTVINQKSDIILYVYYETVSERKNEMGVIGENLRKLYSNMEKLLSMRIS